MALLFFLLAKLAGAGDTMVGRLQRAGNTNAMIFLIMDNLYYLKVLEHL
jgi:hypothetical protein